MSLPPLLSVQTPSMQSEQGRSSEWSSSVLQLQIRVSFRDVSSAPQSLQNAPDLPPEWPSVRPASSGVHCYWKQPVSPSLRKHPRSRGSPLCSYQPRWIQSLPWKQLLPLHLHYVQSAFWLLPASVFSFSSGLLPLPHMFYRLILEMQPPSQLQTTDGLPEER